MLTERLTAAGTGMSPAQRRVAALVAEDPSGVAFGTAAEVADRANTSAQTVLRLANRLGFTGFTELQEAVRSELVARLEPAAARIRRPPVRDVRAQVEVADQANVAASLNVDPEALRRAVALLTDRRRAVVVASAESWRGLGDLLSAHLSALRGGVQVLDGPPPRVDRTIAGMRPADVLVVVDVARYERWIVDVAQRAAGRGASVIAVTDGPLSPLATVAGVLFTVAVESPGPFESPVGVVALFHLLTTAAAERLRPGVAARFDAVEAEWRTSGALVDTGP